MKKLHAVLKSALVDDTNTSLIKKSRINSANIICIDRLDDGPEIHVGRFGDEMLVSEWVDCPGMEHKLAVSVECMDEEDVVREIKDILTEYEDWMDL